MSMLSEQASNLRLTADVITARGVMGGDIAILEIRLREAADTIENLRDSLNEVADKWASEKIKAEDYARENMMLKANNGSRWFELFGTPERTALTLEALMRKCRSADVTLCDSCVMLRSCEEDQALLEWLESEVRDD